MKRKFTLLLSLLFLGFFEITYSQTTNDPAATVYASITSGAWNATSTWETFSSYTAAIAATPGTGTAATSTPSGTHNVLIRSGHTVTLAGANRACKSVIVQNGGKLWQGDASAFRLQVGGGGTGFSYPLTDTVQIDGTLGGPGDGLFIETGAQARYVNISGSGTIDIGRIRMAGGAGASGGGLVDVNVNANVSLHVATNYGFSTVLNPTVTDNYTLTIKPGKTVTMTNATTTFHNSQNSTTYGQHTYIIQGTLDLSATTATSSFIAPAPAASKVNLRIDGGTLRLGAAFKADTSLTSPVSAGILGFRILNGGTLDALLTTSFNVNKTTDGAGGVRDLVFATDATSTIQRNVGASEVKFPLGLDSLRPGTVRITNSGTADNFTVRLKPTFDNTPPDATKVVSKQWNIDEAVPGGSNATVKLSWVTAEQASGFNPAGNVSILRWDGAAWVTYAATVSGSGTSNDPYVATASGITDFSPFIVANTAAIPAPVTFINVRAYGKNSGAQVEWKTAEESGILRYVIERSNDGRNFTQAGTVASANRVAASYSWFDAAPNTGDNYYRIVAVEADGRKYTSILKVNIGGKVPALVIAPNPVRGRSLNVQLSGVQKGIYALRIINNGGQQVVHQTLTVEGTSLNELITLPSLTSGVYSVQLSNGVINLSRKIIVE